MAKRVKERGALIEHTFLHVSLTDFDVSIDAAVNHNLRDERPRPGTEDEYAFEFATRLELTGHCTYPDKRAGDLYKVIIWTQKERKGDIPLTLKDFQRIGEDHSPEYKSIRGVSVPVYDPPNGMSVTTKRHGEPIWDVWMQYPPGTITDMLILLSHTTPLYLTLHETKKEKKRWIQSLTLQTTIPE